MNITQILLGIILILGGVATLIVWPYIKTHVSAEQLSILAGIAQTVVFAAEKIFENGKTVSAGELVPNYLRLAQAEREKLQKEGKL